MSEKIKFRYYHSALQTFYPFFEQSFAHHAHFQAWPSALIKHHQPINVALCVAAFTVDRFCHKVEFRSQITVRSERWGAKIFWYDRARAKVHIWKTAVKMLQYCCCDRIYNLSHYISLIYALKYTGTRIGLPYQRK